MPNWCANKLIVECNDKKELKKFHKKFTDKDAMKGYGNLFVFDVLNQTMNFYKDEVNKLLDCNVRDLLKYAYTNLVNKQLDSLVIFRGYDDRFNISHLVEIYGEIMSIQKHGYKYNETTLKPKRCQISLNNIVPQNPISVYRKFMTIDVDERDCDLTDMQKDVLKDWYENRLSKWGCKWDVGVAEFSDLIDSNPICSYKYVYTYKFDTAWCPPMEFVQTASEKFPELTFNLVYSEEGCGLFGITAYSEGEILFDTGLDQNRAEEIIYNEHMEDADKEFELAYRIQNMIYELEDIEYYDTTIKLINNGYCDRIYNELNKLDYYTRQRITQKCGIKQLFKHKNEPMRQLFKNKNRL